MTLALDALARRLRALTARRRGVTAGLWGEAGIGKTHAALGLLRATPCRNLSVDAAAPLGEVARALPRPARLPPWVRDALSQPGVAEVRAMSAWLGRLAPFVLHVEDLHAASPGARGTWSAVARQVGALRGVGLLVTSRTPPGAPFEAVQVPPLSAEATADLLRGAAGAALPADAVLWVTARAGGNPLFTLEYFRLLTRQGCVWNDGRRWHWREPAGQALPVTVEALLAETLGRVCTDPARRAVVVALALLGPRPPAALWGAAAGVGTGALRRAVDALVQQGVLDDGDFAHPLYREVALRGADPGHLAAVARRGLLVTPLDSRRVLALIGAADLPAAEAVAHLVQAAGAAQRAGDRSGAGACLEAAADRASGPAQGQLAFEAAQALRPLNLERATRLARRAVTGQPAAERVALLAELYAAQGQRAELDALLRGGRDGEAPQARAAETLGLRVLLGDYAQARRVLDDAPALRRDPPPERAPDVARTLLEAGDVAGAQALAARYAARPASKEVAAGWLKLTALTRYYAGDHAGAHAAFSALLGSLGEDGAPRERAAALFNRSLTLEHLQRYPEAAADLALAAHLCRAVGDHKRHAHLQVMAARLLLPARRYAEAEDALLPAHGVLEALGPSGFLVDCAAALSDLYRRWRPAYGADLARRYAQQALATARTLGSPARLATSLYHASMAESTFGAPALGLALAGEMLTCAQEARQQEALHFAAVAQARALEGLSRPLEAAAALDRATALAPGPVEWHGRRLDLARLTGDAAGAATHAAWLEARGLLDPDGARPAGAVEGSGAALHVLGEMTCGTPAGPVRVRGRQRQALLATLLQERLRGRAEVSGLDLIGALYPQAPDALALGALKELVHQTRAALGAAVIQTTASGYALGAVGSDAEAFLQTGELGLWRGPFLSGVTVDVDEQVRDTLHRAAQARAEAALSTDPAGAARLGRLLAEAEPYEPALLSLTLRALQAAGNHRTLARVYQAARARWAEVGDALPADWRAFVAAQSPPVPAPWAPFVTER